MTTSLEYWVLAAVNVLDDPYAVTIRSSLRQITGKPIQFGSIYKALGRLEDFGLITSWMTAATPERNGHAKRNYRIQKAGKIVLKEAVTSGVPVLESILASGSVI